MKTKVVKSCPMCGNNYYISVEKDRADLIGGLFLVQELFPELNATEREFLKSGYCPKCQKMLLGKGSTRKVRVCK